MEGARAVLPRPVQAASPLASLTGAVQSALKTFPTPSSSKAIAEATPIVRETVLWTKFDESGEESPTLPQHVRPYLLVGYVAGLHVWDIRSEENVIEVLSFRDNTVLCAKVLTAPASSDEDVYREHRPLLALHQTSDSRKSIEFFSLRNSGSKSSLHPTGAPGGSVGLARKKVHSISVDSSPLRIESNQHVMAVVFESMIRLYSTHMLEYIYHVDGCRPCINSHLVLPIALGTDWLAFPTVKEIAQDLSQSGAVDGVLDSASGVRMAAVVGMAQKTGSNLVSLSGMGVKTVSDMINGTSEAPPPAAYRKSQHLDDSLDGPIGVVMVIETRPTTSRTLAHFRAHYKPVAALEFDPSGTLLATACEDGQTINIFSLACTSISRSSASSVSSSAAASMSSASAATHTPTISAQGRMVAPSSSSDKWKLAATHLYVLQRGLTTGNICSINFSIDARWVSVISEKGTIHFFPISRKGGQVSVRSHTAPTATNYSSFHTSSGILDVAAGKSAAPVEIPGALLKLKFPPSSSDQRLARTNPSAAASGAGASSSSAAPSSSSRSSGIQLGPGDHPLPGFLVSCAFNYFEYFEEADRRISWKSNSAIPPSGLSVLVATPNGELIEHRLLPYGPGSKDRAQDAVMAGGGTLPEGERIMNAVNSLVEGVTGVFSMAAGASRMLFRQSPSQSPPSQPPHPRDDASSPHASNVGLVCAATRVWDICRWNNWTTADTLNITGKHRSDRATSSATPLGPQVPGAAAAAKPADSPKASDRKAPRPTPGRQRGQRGASAGVGRSASNPVEEMAWLSNIETNTCSALHRRIWMGPQFTFKTYVPLSASGAPATLSVADDSSSHTAPGAGASPGGYGDLYFKQMGLRARTIGLDSSDQIPMIASHHGDPFLITQDMHVGTPIQDAPISAQMNESSLAELQECLAEGGFVSYPVRPESIVSSSVVSSRQTPTMEDNGIFSMDPLVPPHAAAAESDANLTSSLMEAMADDDAAEFGLVMNHHHAEKPKAQPPVTPAARQPPKSQPHLLGEPLRPAASLISTAPLTAPKSDVTNVSLDEPPMSFSPPKKQPDATNVSLDEPPMSFSPPKRQPDAQPFTSHPSSVSKVAPSSSSPKVVPASPPSQPRVAQMKAEDSTFTNGARKEPHKETTTPVTNGTKSPASTLSKKPSLVSVQQEPAAATATNGIEQKPTPPSSSPSSANTSPTKENGHATKNGHKANGNGTEGPSSKAKASEAKTNGASPQKSGAHVSPSSDVEAPMSIGKSKDNQAGEYSGWPDADFDPFLTDSSSAAFLGPPSEPLDIIEFSTPPKNTQSNNSPGSSKKSKSGKNSRKNSPSAAVNVPSPAIKNGVKQQYNGSPRSGEEVTILNTPPSLLVKQPPKNGLVVALGDADAEAPMHRVHSNVSLSGLEDALADDL